MTDKELIQKIHSGDKEVLGVIIDRYYADIYRFCLYMVQYEEDAYDITQESFLKFIKYGTLSEVTREIVTELIEKIEQALFFPIGLHYFG